MDKLSKIKTNIQGAPSMDEGAILSDLPEPAIDTTQWRPFLGFEFRAKKI